MNRFPTILVFALLAALIACEDDFNPGQSTTPIEVRSTTPDEGAEITEIPFNLSVTFNQELSGASEVLMQLFPPPTSTGNLTTTGSGRNVTWFSVRPDPANVVQRLIIDSGRMEVPFMLTFFTGMPAPRARFGGTVRAAAGSQISPRGALVFAIGVFDGFNPLDPASFNNVEPLAIAVVGGDADDTEVDYDVIDLPLRDSFLVVSILDTNSDAVYDPTTDWWGYHGDQLSNNPLVVTAYTSFNDSIATNVDVILGPPRGKTIAIAP